MTDIDLHTILTNFGDATAYDVLAQLVWAIGRDAIIKAVQEMPEPKWDELTGAPPTWFDESPHD